MPPTWTSTVPAVASPIPPRSMRRTVSGRSDAAESLAGTASPSVGPPAAAPGSDASGAADPAASAAPVAVASVASADPAAVAASGPSPSVAADGSASGSGSGAITPTRSGGAAFARDRLRGRFGGFGVASGIGSDLGQRR